METIDIPISWLRKTKWYARYFGDAPDKPPTAEEMRKRGYTINAYTWPAVRWQEGDR